MRRSNRCGSWRTCGGRCARSGTCTSSTPTSGTSCPQRNSASRLESQRVDTAWARFAEQSAHESIVRETVADNPPPSPSRGGWLENSHVIHHRRHPVGRVVTGVARDLHHWLIRPCALGRRDRAVPRGAGERTTRTGIAITVSERSPLDPVRCRSIISCHDKRTFAPRAAVAR
jgi:hypothetical protein